MYFLNNGFEYPKPLSRVLVDVRDDLLTWGSEIKTEKWQGIDLTHPMWEILGVTLFGEIPPEIGVLEMEVKPNLPWAYEQFKERIGGLPLNPGETYKQWPYYKMDDKMRTVGLESGRIDASKENESNKPKEAIFSHTYMERFWPKRAGYYTDRAMKHIRTGPKNDEDEEFKDRQGIRYELGDYNDLIELLRREPDTRQAFLPIWFPEDTGVNFSGRVPCTLGYWFIIRDGKLHLTYYIRSCDYIRHLRDDIYMAILLVYDILGKLGFDIYPGNFTMHIGSLHIFKHELKLLRDGKY